MAFLSSVSLVIGITDVSSTNPDYLVLREKIVSFDGGM